MADLFNELQERILSLDEDINEKALKFYIAYKLNKNFAEIVVQSKGLPVYFDIDASKASDPEKKTEDVSNKGNIATGQLRMKVNTPEGADYYFNIIKQSYENQL